MTYAVEALAKVTKDEKEPSVWTIIMLTDAKRRADRYANDHNMNGGIPLRVVRVWMTDEAKDDCCPFMVEVSLNDPVPTRFRYEVEANNFAGRHLNSTVSTRRLEKAKNGPKTGHSVE